MPKEPMRRQLGYCEGCMFFHPLKSRPSYGFCRRFPPTLDSNDEPVHPEVTVLDWCGEYKGRRGRPAKAKVPLTPDA